MKIINHLSLSHLMSSCLPACPSAFCVWFGTDSGVKRRHASIISGWRRYKVMKAGASGGGGGWRRAAKSDAHLGMAKNAWHGAKMA